MLVFTILWLLGVYCPMAHMVWGKGGLFNIGVGDVKGALPALDFAGGTVVHISSGIAGLACALHNPAFQFSSKGSPGSARSSSRVLSRALPNVRVGPLSLSIAEPFLKT